MKETQPGINKAEGQQPRGKGRSKQVDQVAKQYGIDENEFGKFIEEYKRKHGGCGDLSWSELRKQAEQILGRR